MVNVFLQHINAIIFVIAMMEVMSIQDVRVGFDFVNRIERKKAKK